MYLVDNPLPEFCKDVYERIYLKSVQCLQEVSAPMDNKYHLILHPTLIFCCFYFQLRLKVRNNINVCTGLFLIKNS